MPGPWEKYAQSGGNAESSGPWSKYKDQGQKNSFNPEAALQGFGQFASSGYLPEWTGAVGKLLPDPNADVDAKLQAQGAKIQQPAFQGVTTDESRALQQKLAQESPGSYYAGGAGGAIASAPVYGAVLKGLGIAKAVPAVQVASDAPLLTKAGAYASNLGARALQTGKEGAALGFAANPNTNPGDQGFNLGSRIGGAAATGAVSGALPIAGAAIKGLTQAGKSAATSGATKLLSSLGGVKPDIIQEYAQFSNRINSAPSVDDLKQISDDFVGKLASDVDAKNLTLAQSQDAFKAFQSDLKDGYRSAGYDARDAVASAQQSLKDAHNERIQNLSQDIYDTVKQLKSDVSKGSGESYQILDQSGASIPVAPIKNQITSLIDGLKIAGKSAVGEDASSAVNQLQKLSDTLDEFPQNIPAAEAKKMLQQLQRSTDYARGSGTFSDSANRAFQTVNGSLNSALKSQVPEYGAKMQQVAADTDLLNRVSDFGDKQTAAGILNRIQAPNQVERKAALDQLGAKYNADFVGAANPQSLPEYGRLQNALANQESLRPDRIADKIDQTLLASRQKAQLDSAQSRLNQAQEDLAPFKSLAPNSAGQTQAQQKLMQLSQGKNIELENMFKKLGSLTNTDFVQAMKDRNTLAAFQKGATNGSRNTLMGSMVGFLFGGIPGAAGGGAAGRVVDQWGPAITKKVLDGAIAVSKSPSVQAISKLNLPEPIKRNMMLGLQNYEGTMSKSRFSQPGMRKVASDKQAPQGAPQGHYSDGGIVASSSGKTLGQTIGYPDSNPEPAKSASNSQPLPQSKNAQQQGETLGHRIGYPGMQAGGIVPGKAPYRGNNKKNDIVPADLSAGEDVIPRNVMQSNDPPDEAKQFVKETLIKNGMSQHLTGEDKWVAQGIQKLGIQNQDLAQRLLQDPKGKKLLIQASDLKPGSKAMTNVMNQIQKGWGKS